MIGQLCRGAARAAAARVGARGVSGLPFRIRAPLARLQEKKGTSDLAHRPASLGDGEQLETNSSAPGNDPNRTQNP